MDDVDDDDDLDISETDFDELALNDEMEYKVDHDEADEVLDEYDLVLHDEYELVILFLELL
jgi:hypothetical protein